MENKLKMKGIEKLYGIALWLNRSISKIKEDEMIFKKFSGITNARILLHRIGRFRS